MDSLEVIEGGIPDEVPRHAVAIQPSEITGLISLFQSMLDRTERNILDRLDENSRGASDRWSRHETESAERWARHDTEHAQNVTKVVARFEAIETRVAEHHRIAHEAQIRADARILPIRYSVGWLWANRRDIIVVLIGIGVLTTLVLDAVTHVGLPR